MRAALLCLALSLVSCTSSVQRAHTGSAEQSREPVHHYAYFARDRERMVEPGFLATPRLEGAQAMYAWKELEPAKGVYDFAELRRDLDLLRSRGKKLWLQLQDASFSTEHRVLPRYLLDDPGYHGGAVPQFDREQHAGWVARRWDPAVRARFHALLAELGKALDGELAGVNLQETAMEVVRRDGDAPPLGFTPEAYRDAVRLNMTALRRSFSRSVTMQYANFMPGEWLPDEDHGYLASIYGHARYIGLAVGAPDLMPHRQGQRDHAYRFMQQLGNEITVGIAVQDGNYAGTTGDDVRPAGPWQSRVPELYAYAMQQLKVRYIFWAAQEPYFSHDLLPFLQRAGGDATSR